MKRFRLGEKVVASGKLVKAPINQVVVTQIENAVLNHGITATSKKYNVDMFWKAKEGIIVGARSIADTRVHYCEHDLVSGKHYVTKTKRKKVFLVATDMRGMFYVPEELLMNAEEYYELVDELEEEDVLFDDEDDFDMLDDDFDGDEDLL